MARQWRMIGMIIVVVWSSVGLTAELLPSGATIDRGFMNGFAPRICPQHYVSYDADMLACPKVQGLTILPAHYPPRTLFVGYSPEPNYLAFLSTLFERNANRKIPFQIIVLIPRLDTEQAYRDLKPYIERSQTNHLTFFTAPSDETLWMQDYLELGLSLPDGRLKIIDLPYGDREGEAIPAAIALSCQFDLITQPGDNSYRDPGQAREHGNYGGNIEALPGNLLLIGNTMSQITQQHLRNLFPKMSVMRINVRWLETGHVDELFAVLPNHANQATCPFAMAYASPKLALALVKQSRLTSRKRILPFPASVEDVSTELQNEFFFTQCLSRYAHNKIQAESCYRFIEANIVYEQLIQQERDRIHAALIKNRSCSSINWIALPQLFVPSHHAWLRESTWGSDADEAQALNPNAINMIVLGEEVIVPEQPYKPFTQEISRRLEGLGLSLVHVDSALSHYLSGGLHCNTSVARMCRARHCTGQKIKIADIVDKYDALAPLTHSRAASGSRAAPLACLVDLRGCFESDQIHSEKHSWLGVYVFLYESVSDH